jgi:hypothetical protein
LAAITLFVFSTLRDYGPLSAVRRFHEALRSNDLNDLHKVTEDPFPNPYVRPLLEFLGRCDESGASSHIAGMDRNPGEVDILVFYQFPDHEEPRVWVVDKNRLGNWVVNAEKTVHASAAL